MLEGTETGPNAVLFARRWQPAAEHRMEVHNSGLHYCPSVWITNSIFAGTNGSR